MSHNQPPVGPPSWIQAPPPPPMPPQPTNVPKWARKRVLIPAAVLLLGIGAGIGGSGDNQKTVAAKPAPRVTVTATAASEGKPAPAPTVTVTKTAKAAPVKATPKKAVPAAPKDKVVFKVWGSAPAGVDITYGSDSDNLQGRGLPMTKTLTLKDDALYYDVTAQLQGGGDVHCSVTVDGKTKTGHASGGYNICSAQLNGGLFGDWS
ncbi:MmpS family transport accessory protein [Streptomyces sp. NBC_00268]|uniref:MmpS family transport accessory protein n=1 Tax=Streptomyces sp. NBC_00268 TaxID=2975695 RepID=UPI0022501866|nr:MmpS family transport accessory protein [Streptomyces sp. NBC_00268]MCX5181224.1 MmpS family transport accessory protein [Streptomyces sp. NBC_00268]